MVNITNNSEINSNKNIEVEFIFEDKFKKCFEKIKDKELKIKIIKQLDKLTINPELGKPMKYSRKGTREVYVSPYRLSYTYKNKELTILNLYHKDKQ